jgi:hypothetical protein
VIARILAVLGLLLASAPALAQPTGDTFTMFLVEERAQPRGVRNVCRYQVRGYTVVIGARTPDVTCAPAIRWQEWDFTHATSGDCEYHFPSGNVALARDGDGNTACYKSARVTFLSGTDI